MNRENAHKSMATKVNPSLSITLDAASVWQKREKPARHRAPTEHWSRYIDSRLKQFTSR